MGEHRTGAQSKGKGGRAGKGSAASAATPTRASSRRTASKHKGKNQASILQPSDRHSGLGPPMDGSAALRGQPSRTLTDELRTAFPPGPLARMTTDDLRPMGGMTTDDIVRVGAAVEEEARAPVTRTLTEELREVFQPGQSNPAAAALPHPGRTLTDEILSVMPARVTTDDIVQAALPGRTLTDDLRAGRSTTDEIIRSAMPTRTLTEEIRDGRPNRVPTDELQATLSPTTDYGREAVVTVGHHNGSWMTPPAATSVRHGRQHQPPPPQHYVQVSPQHRHPERSLTEEIRALPSIEPDTPVRPLEKLPSEYTHPGGTHPHLAVAMECDEQPGRLPSLEGLQRVPRWGSGNSSDGTPARWGSGDSYVYSAAAQNLEHSLSELEQSTDPKVRTLLRPSLRKQSAGVSPVPSLEMEPKRSRVPKQRQQKPAGKTVTKRTATVAKAAAPKPAATKVIKPPKATKTPASAAVNQVKQAPVPARDPNGSGLVDPNGVLPPGHKPARGRGRPIQLKQMTPEQIRVENELQLERNRQAARQTRERKRNQILDLENRAKALQEASDKKNKLIGDLQLRIAELEAAQYLVRRTNYSGAL
eukprot:m.37820 g.37820  ORF g.37820 m.37820 type:complete len:589 (-) comp7741_c0_seq1:144-1910(-)